MSDGTPLPNGTNGRDAKGRFVRGNAGGPGNPHAAQVARLRSALLRAVGPGEIRRIVESLVNAAVGGDVPAAKLLLAYVLGEPAALDLLDRLERLEQRMEATTHESRIQAAN